jgi:phosphatidylserine synthase
MEAFNQIILYFFSPLPGREFTYYIPLIILIVALLITSIYIPLYIKNHKEDKGFKKVFRGYPATLQLMAFLLALYTLFRYYYVPFFSMRFLLYLLIIVTGYLIYSLIRAYYKKYPAEKEMRQYRKIHNEYIPSKKKNKKK